MGFKKLFAQLEKEVTKAVESGAIDKLTGGGSSSKPTLSENATRWEKAVVAASGIASQVSRVDPDGIDIVCFGGNDEAQWYRNVKNTKGIEEMVNDKRPRGVSISYEF